MSAETESWPALSYLEGLRPGPDEHVELALLASYSADLGSIGAALLALAGKDNDSGGGSASDFADAVERLRGKTRIVIQRGRLARMRRTPRIAAVLDQFVREVAFDEARQSWHPKAALVRIRSDDDVVTWRLWIGSRNLTECVNRDMGLLLVSGGTGARAIPGIVDLARSLAEHADLKGLRPASLVREIGKLQWRAPTGVTVEQIRWHPGGGVEQAPVPPDTADEVTIVSPFVDKTFLSRQLSAGRTSARRVLLTTMREIERVGPALGTFDDLLALDAPEYPVGDPASEESTDKDHNADRDEEEEIGRGLHAKLLFWRDGRKRTLWLGSANATMRAWTGRNAEVVAELQITEPVERGLRALIGTARLASASSMEHVADDLELEEEALERARAQVAARWAATIELSENGVALDHRSDLHPEGPHPDEADIALEVGALHGPLLTWPPGISRLMLGNVLPAERSEFVRLRVSRGSLGLAWLQRAPAEPPFGEDRDRAAFVRFLGARGFLLWLAGLLADDGREGEGDWTVEQRDERANSGSDLALDPGLPTLEEMMAAWARSPARFHEIERRVSQYLPAILEHADQEDPDMADLLKRFGALWATLRVGLGHDQKSRR
ncbi:MAG: phospholipase D family protein [Novosphingobium sp.]|nr:phospholipase D family protein [Novosphingobium sp.]